VLVAIFGLTAFGTAGQQSSLDNKNCGTATTHSTVMGTAETAKLDTVLGDPEDYFGKTVTVEGEMHRTFSDKVFSIEDDDFLRDDDLLIITTASKAEVVTPVKDSIDEGEDVTVTGVIVPFNRAEMECKYGPLQIESRASHYKEGDAVMIIDRAKAAAAEPAIEEQVAQLPAPEPEPAPVAEELDQPAQPEEPAELAAAEPAPVEEPAVQEPEQPAAQAPAEDEEELPSTAGGLPLLALGGALSLLTGLGVRFYKR
jgi:hypothetical protein